MYEQIAIGILGGAGWGILRFAREYRLKGESFEFGKFAYALVFGGAVGAYAAYSGIDLELVDAGVLGAISIAVQNVFEIGRDLIEGRVYEAKDKIISYLKEVFRF